MKISRQQLFHLSRDRRFLIRVSLIIAGISLVAGLAVSLLTNRSQSRVFPGESLESVMEELEQFSDPSNFDTARMAGWIRNPEWVYGHFTDQLRERGHFGPQSEWGGFEDDLKKKILPFVEESISRSERIDPSERKLLIDLFNGLHGDSRQSDDALESLRSAAATEPFRRYASEFLGDVLAHRDNNEEALETYHRENERFRETAQHSRLQIVRLLREEERDDELKDLFEDPDFRKVLPMGERIRVGAELGNWGMVFFTLLANDLRVGVPALFALSLIAGGIWLIIVTQFSGYGRIRVTLYILALVLGWFSATATLFVVYIQDMRGFVHDPRDPLVQQLIFCLAGVGLREETLKLLFFIPLVPFLYRRGSEIEALVCGGLVGLGFAINENANYVESFGAFTAWSRFLTANFLHIAMTGVIGLAFFRMCRSPRRQWDNFLYDFLIVVAIHGAYDALGIIPQLVDYQALWLVVYALTAYLFLDHATRLMQTGSGQVVSPLGVFVVGSATLIGIILVYASWGSSFGSALTQYVRSLADMFPIAFVFINRLGTH